ncbi:MAG: polysaccharide export protein [Proteobacteria bacterium]|nr:polysaccharide export protein [Pseudomonadota bacterium]
MTAPRFSCLAITLMLLSLAWVPEPVFADSEYRLGPGDEIQIQVYREDDLSMQLMLDETGTFDYPYLGTLNALGKTVKQLKEEITRGLLQDILINPSVNVAITRYRSFYIGGEVKRAGSYPYLPGLTVRQAITLAGGPTEWASPTKFEILREGESTAVNADNSTPVRPGDTVTVLEGMF